MMGNRGILHDDHQRIVRQWQVRRWITCLLEFRGRRRKVMQPRRYTELFFLDEAASLSAGHRPCAECRRADYNRFVEIWHHVIPSGVEGRPSADSIDLQLHADRLDHKRKRTYRDDLKNLPDGTYVALDGRAWLVWDSGLFAWADAGYDARQPRRNLRDVEVLTPRSTVAILSAGYRPGVILIPSTRFARSG
jgi:hypothetical protein